MQLYRIKTSDNDTYEFTTQIDLNESYIHRIEKIIEHINFNTRYKNEYAKSIKRKIYRETNIVITLIKPYSSELHPERRGLNTMVTNNKPNVTLITHTPNPEKLIAMAAKLCYSAANIQSLDENLTDDQIHKFVRMLSQIGHESPIEHITFTFGIENISRACSHQLVRHRIASYSQQSQRYVNGEKFEYIIPPAIAQSSANKSYNALLDTISNAYVDIRNQLILDQISAYSASHSDFSLKRYTDITSQKKSILNDFKATFPALYSTYEKKANEDARFILPNACTTKIICTFNARSLFNFFSHRCCNRAQWEIREVAEQMLLECKKIAPNVFAHCGPECLFGNCPEGKMSCGRQKEMRNKYGIIETEKTTHKA